MSGSGAGFGTRTRGRLIFSGEDAKVAAPVFSCPPSPTVSVAAVGGFFICARRFRLCQKSLCAGWQNLSLFGPLLMRGSNIVLHHSQTTQEPCGAVFTVSEAPMVRPYAATSAGVARGARASRVVVTAPPSTKSSRSLARYSTDRPILKNMGPVLDHRWRSNQLGDLPRIFPTSVCVNSRSGSALRSARDKGEWALSAWRVVFRG